MAPAAAPRRRARILIRLCATVIVLVALAALIVVAVDSLEPGGARTDDRFEPAARRAAETGRPFDLGVVADADWDRVFVLPDYADRKVAERETGASWADGDDVFGQRDGVLVLVFVRGRRVVSSATVGMQPACLMRPEGFPRSARFTSRIRDGVSTLSELGKPAGTGC